MINIVMLVDVSLSIKNVVDFYASGINNIIGYQRHTNPRARFTLYKFSQEISTLCLNVPITEVKPISWVDLKPGGITALYKSVYEVARMNLNSSDPTICIVMTDGDDVCGGVKPSDVAKLVWELSSRNWSFIFFGASDNANKIGRSMGINTCVLYNNTPESLQRASNAMNIAISKVTAHVTGVQTQLSSQELPLDVRELLEAMEEMKI